MNYEKRLSEQPHEPVRQGFIRELLVVESLPGVAAEDKNADEDHQKYLGRWRATGLEPESASSGREFQAVMAGVRTAIHSQPSSRLEIFLR